jgi:hypothetical protein
MHEISSHQGMHLHWGEKGYKSIFGALFFHLSTFVIIVKCFQNRVPSKKGPAFIWCF